MAKTKLESMRITPAKNGGYTVTHQYKAAPAYKTGKLGGFSMSMPQSEEHSFGPGDGKALLAHLTQHLGMQQERANEAEVGGRLARTRSMRSARQAEAEISGAE